MTNLKQVLTAALLAAAASAAQAQATRMMMPEGTYDLVLGMAFEKTYFSGRNEGSRSVLVPALEVQWSNGIFAEVGTREAFVGMHLSDDPVLDYGVQLAMSGRDQRTDTPGERGGVSVQAGGFFGWRVLHNMSLSGQLTAGGGFDGGGVLAHARARYYVYLAARQGATLAAGLFAADHSWQQGYFGVTAAQSASGGNPAYRAPAGLVSVYGDVEWHWQWANKYSSYTGVRYTRLASGPADSPLVGGRSRISLRTSVNYHF
ncbi:MAG: MipA/OmpV family protein [Pseudomonadota bacterium]